MKYSHLFPTKPSPARCASNPSECTLTLWKSCLSPSGTRRLAWDAHCNGVHAYHAWAFERRDSGVYVLTEETQNGWLARLGVLMMPGRSLEGLGKVAGKEVPIF